MPKRLKFLKQLASIIMSDGNIAPQEEKLFINIARSLGLKIDNVEEIHLLEKISPTIKHPMSYYDRIANIYGMALMIKIDGKIDPKEIETIKNIGIEMGLPVESLDNMLKILFSKKEKLLSMEELKELFNISNN